MVEQSIVTVHDPETLPPVEPSHVIEIALERLDLTFAELVSKLGTWRKHITAWLDGREALKQGGALCLASIVNLPITKLYRLEHLYGKQLYFNRNGLKEAELDWSEWANWILHKLRESNLSVSPMKLQKLLYYLSLIWIYRTNQHALDHEFEAWQHGPVSRKLYTYMVKRLDELNLPHDQSIDISWPMEFSVSRQLNPTEEQAIVDLLARYGSLSASMLRELSHGSQAWNLAYKEKRAISWEELRAEASRLAELDWFTDQVGSESASFGLAG